jgi:hypothetical protein
VPTTNPATQPADTPDVRAVRESAKGFLSALFADDVKDLEAAFAVEKADLDVLRSLNRGLKVTRDLTAALDRKWPRQPGESDGMQRIASKQESLQSADIEDIKIDGDSAAALGSALRFRKIDGRWRVVAFGDRSIDGPAAAVMAKAAGAVLADLAQGKYASRKEAQRAFHLALDEGIKPMPATTRTGKQ